VTVLPDLVWAPSPNCSPRNLQRGCKPYLIVVHRPVGAYHGSVAWLSNPASQASAHIVTEHDKATQLVAWDQKAWHAMAFNSVSYGVEVDDSAWDGSDPIAFATAARIIGYLCTRTGIPPKQALQPTHAPGVVRHVDLGAAGGGHTDPTENDAIWRSFLKTVSREVARGGYRRTWGHGRLVKL